MTNSDFLEIYLNLQDGIISDELINVHSGEAIITFCQADKATYWNFALVKKVLSEQELDDLEQEFIKLKRIPSIYFENKQALSPLKDLLARKGYKLSFKESWMFYEQELVLLPEDYKVICVSNEQELNIFLDIFNKCYQKDDLQNPYGELGVGYMKKLTDAWYSYHHVDRVEYFIFYNHRDPVAVATLTNYKDVGYIANVGSAPPVRGRGFGKLATLHCVKKSIERGHTYHFLATEGGPYLNQFYQRIGFKTKFTTINYAKNKS